MDPGASLGPYRIDRELGSGGMGKVYAATAGDDARAVAAGVTVALKVVHPHLLETPDFFKRFLREAQIGQSVRHPNVVRTLDCDAVEGTHFLAMEYVEGQTLRDLLDEMDRVPEELCRHIGREVSKGLAAIHDAGVVHRDLKPENVLITPDHVVKVMDLGVARLMDEAVRLSQTGAFVGSLHYASPEQFVGQGDDIDGRSDLHALGLVLYELSTGRHPFLADSVPGIVNHVLRTEPRKVGQIHPQLSAFFEEAVQCLLAKDRAARFDSATALLAVLEAGEDSEWWRSRARSLQAETRRPVRRIRIPRETAVYGRDKELTLLRSLFGRASSGEGQVALVEGEAGIGKSRLIDELIAQLQSSGEDLNFLFGSYPPGGAVAAAGAFSTAFREQFGGEGAAPYLPQTPLLVPAFEAVLTGDAAPEGVEPLNKGSLATCFVQAARTLGAERPTVILIDDLHFAPEEARGLFSALAMAMRGQRVLLIGTMRPGVEGDWRGNLQRLEHVTQIQVERLFPKDLAQLLEDTFRSEQLASQLGHQIAVKSDGNPFFAFEIIRGLREGQFITQSDDGTWVSTGVIDEIQIPSSVLDLVSARVSGLTEDERALLDVAACWGHEFDPLLVGEVLGIARIPLLRQLGQIERQHRLVRAVGVKYQFDHHQVQEALYGSLSELLRREYHAALADALEARTRAAERDPLELDGALCVQLCEHFLSGARDESARRYFVAAQAHLTASHLPAQMVALTERALAVPDLLRDATRESVLLRMANALESLGRGPAQRRAIDEAIELAEASGDAARVAWARWGLGHYLEREYQHEAATAELERARDAARQLGVRDLETKATNCLSLVLKNQGRLSEAETRFGQLIGLCRESGDKAGEAGATINLGHVCQGLGRPRAAQEHHERGLAIAREAGLGRFEAAALGGLGNAVYYMGRLGDARTHFERFLERARAIGYRMAEASALLNLASTLRELGESEASEERSLAGLSVCRDIGQRHMEASALHELGSLRAGMGDETAARGSLLDALELAQKLGLAGVEVLARCELALLPDGDAADALRAFTERESRLRPEQLLEARLLLFRATADREHLEHAKRLLDESLATTPEEYREATATKLRVNREILAAWREEFGEDGDAPAGDSPGESPTRAG